MFTLIIKPDLRLPRSLAGLRPGHLLLGACATLLAACGGSGGETSTTPTASAPSNLNYGAPAAFYHAGVAIPENLPSVAGTVTRYEVTPSLPPGLALDPLTGAIAGAPVAPFELAVYTVSAIGPVGEAQTSLLMGAVEPPRVAVLGSADATLSTLLIEAASGMPTPYGFDDVPAGTNDSTALAAGPFGTALYVAHRGDGISLTTLSIWRFDPLTSEITLSNSLPLGAGPHAMTLGPDGRNLYVTAAGADQVWTYRIDPVDDALVGSATALFTGDEPSSVRIEPGGRFAYVANSAGGDVTIHRRDAMSGALSPAGAVKVTGGSPVDLVIDPEGGTAYVLLNDTKRIQSFSIDPTSGDLEDEEELSTGPLPSSITMHPTGRFAWVTESGADRVVSYTVDPGTGMLAQSGVAFAGDNPTRIVLDPAGLHAWVLASDSNEIFVYDVDLATGELDESARLRTREGPQSLDFIQGGTPLERRARHLFVLGSESDDITPYAVDRGTGGLIQTGAAVATDAAPCDVALDVRGRRLFVAAEDGRTIQGFGVDASTGALTPLDAPTAVPGPPCGIVLDPSGKELYVVVREVNQILSFSVDQVTGALTPVASAAAGDDPTHLAMDPTGRHVHASNQTSRSISTYAVEDGVFLGQASIAAAPGEPREVRFSPHGDLAVIALHASNILVPYAVNAETGELTPIPPGRGTEARPEAAVFHPSGEHVFATVSGPTGGTGYTSSFRIRSADSRLVDEFRVNGGLNPGELALDPQGRFLYVLNNAGDDLTVYEIDPVKFELSTSATVSTGLAPSSLVLTTAFD